MHFTYRIKNISNDLIGQSEQMRQTILWLIFFIDNDNRLRYFIFTFKKLFFTREIVNGAFRRRNSDDRASAIYIDRTTIIFHSTLPRCYLTLLTYLTVLTRTCESLRCVKSTENARSDFVSPNNRRECKPDIEKEDEIEHDMELLALEHLIDQSGERLNLRPDWSIKFFEAFIAQLE